MIYGLIGVSIIIFTFISHFFFSISNHILFGIGFLLFFDAIDYRLNKTSFLHKIIRNKIYLLYILGISAFVGFLFDFFGVLISNLWGYRLAPTVGLFQLYVGWAFVLPMFYEAYRVFLTIIKKEFGNINYKLFSKKFETQIFSVLGILGFFLLIIPILFYFFYPVYLNYLFLLSLFGLWFLSEFIEYKRHEKSLLKDILKGYWDPIIAIIISSIFTAILWEFLNLPTKIWFYQNIPLSHIKILDIPLLVILGWVPLYVIYLSFYRAIIKTADKKDIW